MCSIERQHLLMVTKFVAFRRLQFFKNEYHPKNNERLCSELQWVAYCLWAVCCAGLVYRLNQNH
jgi:hypothetical protein